MQLKQQLKAIYLTIRHIFLQVLTPLFKTKTDYIPTAEIKKILFIRIDRIGDLVLSTPALRAIKKTFPDAELTVLASQFNHKVIQFNPFVDRVVVFRRDLDIIGKTSFFRALRSYRYDIAIDPYPDYELKTAFLTWVTGAKVRIGYAFYGREIFLNLPVPFPQNPGHFIDLTLELLKPLGIVSENRQPEIYLTEDELKNAVIWNDEHGLGSKPIIGIHPGAFYPSQRWPSEYFSEIIQMLKDTGLCDIIVFGGPHDGAVVSEILSGMADLPPFLVDEDLRRFMAILSRCQLLICNNSGPLHLSSALGVPTLSFIGPTVDDLWMPVGVNNIVLKMDTLPCIGCNLGYCMIKTHDCMRMISPSMVFNHIRNFITDILKHPEIPLNNVTH